MSVANLVTLARLFAVPLAIWLILDAEYAAAFWLFVAAGVSDMVDGTIAKMMNQRSELGALLDPIADKVLLVSMCVTLGLAGRLPSWLVILVVFRDVLIVGGVLVLSVLGQQVAIQPLAISKLNTVMQIVLVAVALLLAGFGRRDVFPAPWLLSALIWTVVATTLASGTAYLWNAARTR